MLCVCVCCAAFTIAAEFEKTEMHYKSQIFSGSVTTDTNNDMRVYFKCSIQEGFFKKKNATIKSYQYFTILSMTNQIASAPVPSSVCKITIDRLHEGSSRIIQSLSAQKER